MSLPGPTNDTLDVYRDWANRVRAVLDDPDEPQLVRQPIVDLHRGAVAGHEVLSRFSHEPTAPPDVWFASAEMVGLGARLTAHVLERALPLLGKLPDDTFLTVNLAPEHVLLPGVVERLERVGRLDRLFLELTEHAALVNHHDVVTVLDRLRAYGARIAIDDVGAGYSGLQALLLLRPELIKLDRSLVSDIDQDPAKRALLTMIGRFAADIDAWVLAEGIEREDELDELVRLGVPLGQGYLLGSPAPGWLAEVPVEVADRLHRQLAARPFATHIAPLVERVPATDDSASPDTGSVTVIVDEWRRPVALAPRGDRALTHMLLRVKPSDLIADVARRAATRPDGRWSDPVVVCDERGAYTGIVRVARLLEQLATTVDDEPSAG